MQDPVFSNSMCAEKIEKQKEKTKLQKRTIIRYLTASLVLTLSRVSMPVKRRFRNIDEVVRKGLLLEHEAALIKKSEPYEMQPFLPVFWSASIVVKANNKGRLPNESLVIGIIEEINKFRRLLQELFLLDQICVPLVYTQVVTLSIYSYFLSCMVGRQFILEFEKPNTTKDFVIPLFTILEFIVYIGWIKLALTLVNPMGDDDENFDLNSFIDYNFHTGISCVDTLKSEQPPFEKDYFFDSKIYKLPLNQKSKYLDNRPFRGSFCEMKIENENWMTSIKSLLTLNTPDRDVDEEGLIKSLNHISIPNSPRRPGRMPVYSTLNVFATLSVPVQEENYRETIITESVLETGKTVSTEKSQLLVIEEEEQLQ